MVLVPSIGYSLLLISSNYNGTSGVWHDISQLRQLVSAQEIAPQSACYHFWIRPEVNPRALLCVVCGILILDGAGRQGVVGRD